VDSPATRVRYTARAAGTDNRPAATASGVTVASTSNAGRGPAAAGTATGHDTRRASRRRCRRRPARTVSHARSTNTNPGRPGGGPPAKVAMAAQHAPTSSASASANTAAGIPPRAQPDTTQANRSARPARIVTWAHSSPAATASNADTNTS
jgi:hypothetical protein